MQNKDHLFFINNPVFVKIKKKFSLKSLSREEKLKSVFLNERTVEIPFAIQSLRYIPEGGKVLDLGCMESILSLQVASLGYQVTGIDFRDYPYYSPQFHFVHGNILNLPFQDETYDMVYSISTMEHIGMGAYDDPHNGEKADCKALREVFRVLKKGGVFCLTVPFGIFTINARQKVYDQKNLSELLASFHVDEMKFFANSMNGKCRHNFWKPVPQKTAEQIFSDNGTNCVCLVRARK